MVIAAGAGSFVPRRLPLPGAEERDGRSIFYAVRRMEDFRGKSILIAGGGDSALDWILNLHPLAGEPGAGPPARRLSRRTGFGREDARAGRGRPAWRCTSARSASCTGPATCSRASRSSSTDGEVLVPCDTLLAFYGLKMELGPIAEWGLNLDQNLIDGRYRDLRDQCAGHLRDRRHHHLSGQAQADPVSGFHEAALMCQKAFHYCYPEKKLVFRYTTSSTDLHKKLGV